MREQFPRLYAIVDRATLDARAMGVGEFARELGEGGVRLVQYRDKVSAAQEILRAAREIDGAFEGGEVVRVMNDRADLAVLAGWEGVHVGQGDLPVEAVRRVMRDGYKMQASLRSGLGAPVQMTNVVGPIVGLSTHNEEQLRAIEGGPDYVAVGPVFATSSKANPDPVVSLDFVRRAREMTELPIVAIGGITLANARSVIDAGADSVAVIGGVFVEGRRVRDVARDFLEILG